MDKLIQICSFLLGISNLDCVFSSDNIEDYLSILDRTLSENDLTKCDLATFGPSKIFDYEHHDRALISRSKGKVQHINKDVLTHTKCLILLVDEPSQITEVIDLASTIQFKMPVGVMLEVQDLKTAIKHINATVPFPLILKDTGMIMKYNNWSLVAEC